MIEKDLFLNPPKEYRGVPFWSINDRLEAGRVREQIKLMDEAGFGGAFFHAREGLVTPFLGEKWFEAFRAAVEEAKMRGMRMWIYDELWWPSGFAGGRVPAHSSNYRAKALLMIPDTSSYEGEDVVAVFECEVDENWMPVDYRRANPGEESEDRLYLTFAVYTASIGETWFSGFSYVDLLNPEAVEYFIEKAYEPYVQQFRGEFGRTIPGVFTDEPNISSNRPPRRRSMPPRGPRMPPFAIPWSGKLPEKFREINGYDILEKLPELFFNLGDYAKTRYDFWRTVTLLFVESFSKQLYEWCDRHNLKFTGHYLGEDTLLSQLATSGAVMPHYEYQHVPGIDHLGFQIWPRLLTAKQVSSVANQLGRSRVLCETYGCTGNHPTFLDRKWIGDFLYALGVNLLNHHLVPYSLRGRRKRDFGLNLHWGQPWWERNRLIEDHFSRLSYILSMGERLVEVLVIHPIGSIWSTYSPLNDQEARAIDESFRRLLRILTRLHVDFELGDEILMAKHGRVEGGLLKVGRIGYRIVIVPPCKTLSKSTVELLREFTESGGRVIAIGPIPRMIDGTSSDEPKEVLGKATRLTSIDEDLLRKIFEELSLRIRVEGDREGDVLYHARKVDDKLVLFLANTNRVDGRDVAVTVRGSWRAELWDTISGSIEEYPVSQSGEATTIEAHLEPVGSKLFVLEGGKVERRPSVAPRVAESVMDLGGRWSLTRLGPNVLVLDYCRYRIGEGWSDPVPVWRAHRDIVSEGVGTQFALRFEFGSEIPLRDRNVFLVMENPELYRLRINGASVEWMDEGYWLCEAFRKTGISQYVGRGLNTIELEGVVGMEPEIEALYVIGDFGVVAGPMGGSTIVEEERAVTLGDLCEKGVPFYTGSVDLVKEFYLESLDFRRATLKVEGLHAAMAEAYVNNEKAGELFLHPLELDVTRHLVRGRNVLRLRLVGTMRNSLGPLHFRGGDPPFISPETFADEQNWTDDYVLAKFGVDRVLIKFEKVE